MNLPLSAIRADGGTQTRASLNDATVAEYAADMLIGATFPPITVFYDGTDHWLADGFHRLAAAQQSGRDALAADIRQGTRRDAVLFSVGANASHGLRRSHQDKRRAVELLLNDDEWRKWSNREIARRCGVDEGTVRKYRDEVTAEFPQLDNRTYTTKHGTIASMQTSAIGQRSIMPARAPTIERIPFDEHDWGSEAPDDVPEIQVDELAEADEADISARYAAERVGADEAAEVPIPPLARPATDAALVPILSTSLQQQDDAYCKECEEYEYEFDVAPVLVPVLPISQQPDYTSDEWYTPPAYLAYARALLGGTIDLDPASSDVAQQTVQAQRYYTRDDNGLAHDWRGTIWLNPPYSIPGKFVTKLIAEYDAGHVTQAVILLNSSTDTAWFHELAERFPVCLTRGRVSFLRADGKPIEGNRVGQAFFYLGPHVAHFGVLFAPVGLVVQKVGMQEYEEAV